MFTILADDLQRERVSFIDPVPWAQLQRVRSQLDTQHPADLISRMDPIWLMVSGVVFTVMLAAWMRFPVAILLGMSLTALADYLPYVVLGRRVGEPSWATDVYKLDPVIRQRVIAVRAMLRPVQRAQVGRLRTGRDFARLLARAEIWREGSSRMRKRR